MSSLDEARRKIEESRNKQGAGGGEDLWMRQDDLVIAHHISTGGEGDPYFDTYFSHEEKSAVQGRYSELTYCPVLSGHDENYNCLKCRDGVKAKPRMAMWFWVYDILHSTMPPNTDALAQIDWNGKKYFQRPVNAPKIWDTSAWRESPLDDILMLFNQLKSLHATRINLACTGKEMTKRFKHYMEPGSPPLDPALYEEAKTKIVPVSEWLMSKLVAMPTQANPQQMQAPATTAAVPANVIPYTPSGSAPAAAPTYVPGASANKGKDLF